MTTPARALTAALALAAAAPAAAHETLHEIRRTGAIAVRASLAGGAALADAPYEVWSPADRELPWQRGRTDRAGWLAFVPDAPGRWRVRVFEGGGHGLELEVEAAEGAGAPAPAPGASPPSGAGPVLRPLAGLLVIGAVFAALFLARRRRRDPP